MRKFLVGAILGALVADHAGASIISRSFLDQALTDYATNTALDLKADQSDFTDLNTQIKDSVILLRELWNEDSYWFLYATNPEYYSENIIGAFSLLKTYLVRLTYGLVRGWADTDGTSYMGLVELNNGWTDSESNTYLGVKGLNDKIGTLPEGITVQNMFQGWTHNDRYFPGLSTLSDYPTIVEDAYNIRLSEGRAKAVYDEMVRRGIDPKRMKWQGKGEREPIESNKTEEGRAANRRVEFKIL